MQHTFENQATAERFKKLQSAYEDDPTKGKIRQLLYGQWGTGKTLLSSTMPRPIYYEMFDPGGDKLAPIQKGVKEGSIVVNKEYAQREFDDPGDLFNEWNKGYNEMKQEGFFADMGTYILDSITSFQRLVISATLAGNYKNKIVSGKMPIKVPEIRDYNVNDAAMMYALTDILNLPCHVVIIAHMEASENEATSMYETKPLIIGSKLREKVPTLFDEIYLTRFRGKKYELLTQPEGYYMARSRLASSGKVEAKFQTEEIGGINLTRDILVPSGYASEDEVVDVAN